MSLHVTYGDIFSPPVLQDCANRSFAPKASATRTDRGESKACHSISADHIELTVVLRRLGQQTGAS